MKKYVQNLITVFLLFLGISANSQTRYLDDEAAYVEESTVRDLSDNTVIQHISSQPDGLHPFNNNSSIRSFIFQYTQKTLIKLDLETLEYIPYLVESMPEISEDGLKYIYKIKDGITWDDGTLFTAKDVAFSVKLMLCPLTNNTQIRGNYNTIIESIEIDKKDPLKFTMHANDIHVDNKYIFSELYIQQKDLWDPKGVLNNVSFEALLSDGFKGSDKLKDWFNSYNNDDNSYNPEFLVGLGAYQVTEWVSSQYITIAKKDNWWGSNDPSIYNKAFPDRIIFKIIYDNEEVVRALLNQDIDVTNRLSISSIPELINHPDFKKNYDFEFVDRYSYNYIGLNCKPNGVEFKKFFTDKKVRRAIAHTIPVDEIIDVVLNGKATRQASQISPLKKTYNDTLKLILLDIEQAKKMLDEAGWIDTDGDNIRDKIVDGEKLQMSFKLSYMSSPLAKEIVFMIKESMYKAGVDAIPNPMDFTLFYNNAQEHKFDAMLGGWGGSASYSNPMQLWHTNSWVTKGSNFCGFGDAESDSYIEEANTSLDYKKHKAALWKLQSKVYEEQPYIFMYASKNKIAIHKRFDNRNMYTERPGVILNNLKIK